MSKIIRENFVDGDIDNDPLATGGATLNAAELADLPVVASPDVARIVIDPEGSSPEVVYVTAHTASATSATITRGQEGSTAQEWPVDTPWVHGPTREDFLQPDTGNMLGGDAEHADSVAVHPAAKATHHGDVAVGRNAVATGHATFADNASVAVGQDAIGGRQSVSIGQGAEATAQMGIAIGLDASATGAGASGAVAIGRNASATVTEALAVGRSASATTRASVAVGFNASASGTISATHAVAIGSGASTTHQNAVALGAGTSSSATFQVMIGPRHLEIGDVSTPGTPAAGFGRLAFRDNDGTQELVAVFDTGEVKVLADGTA